jgi:hypothetical protein
MRRVEGQIRNVNFAGVFSLLIFCKEMINVNKVNNTDEQKNQRRSMSNCRYVFIKKEWNLRLI